MHDDVVTGDDTGPVGEESRDERASMADVRELPVPMPWRVEIEQWELALRAGGLSRETLRTRTDHLRRASRALEGTPWTVTAPQLFAWVGRQEWRRETRRSVYASLRSFWGWGVRTGRTLTSPAAELPTVRPETPSPHPTPERVYRRALEKADRRERLILLLGAGDGLRRGEICQVNSRDIVDDLVGVSLVVHGKGGKDRLVPLEGPVIQLLREACMAGGGWAFPGRVGGHLSAQRVGNLVSRLMPDGWTLHSLRHRAGTIVRAASGLDAAQELLGHASPVTTRRYCKLPDDAVRRGVRAAAA